MIKFYGNKLTEANHVGGEIIPAYFPSPEIIEAVNLAIILKRPLLIVGEDGSDMKNLPKSIAFEFYGNDFRTHYFEWFLKSSTTLKEGLYNYDEIARLRDAQTFRDSKDARDYLSYGVAGRSMLNSTVNKLSILWIDRINRVGQFFLDELLEVIYVDRGFFVPEINHNINSETPPIVIVTLESIEDINERTLRQFIFLPYPFPERQSLLRIVSPRFQEISNELLDKTVDKFLEYRNSMEKNKPGINELVDWLSVIRLNIEKNNYLVDFDGLFSELFNYLTPSILYLNQRDERNRKPKNEESLPELKSELIGLLSNDRVAEVISKLQLISQTVLKDSLNEIVITGSRFHSLNREKNQNSITIENYNIEKNRIIASILSIIDKL